MERKRRVLVLFPEPWDREAFASPEIAHCYEFFCEGFDLFQFPSNTHLLTFEARHFLDRLERKYRRIGLDAVVSNHELWGVLLAAELAERLGLPGHPPAAILACQHKHYGRTLHQRLVPEATPRFTAFPHTVRSPADIDLPFPFLVKPVKATFSILARRVASFDELCAHLRFGVWERFLLRKLIRPFEELCRERLALPVSSYGFLAEEFAPGWQVNADGYAAHGEVHIVGLIDAVTHPGSLAFQRFEAPSALPAEARARVEELAARVARGLGLTHGFFNVELFWHAAEGSATLIEVNPRLAYQLSDLYRRVDGLDLHRAQLALACGEEPELEAEPGRDGAAASFVYRSFDGRPPARWPGPTELGELARLDPAARLHLYPKGRAARARDMKWLGSYRYALLHLGRPDHAQLHAAQRQLAALLGFPPLTDLSPSPTLPGDAHLFRG